jgi:hypothetical protein
MKQAIRTASMFILLTCALFAIGSRSGTWIEEPAHAMRLGEGIGLSKQPTQSAAWTPISLQPTVWFRADKGITLNGSNVSAWADQSGNGNSASQGTSGDQPAFSATGNPLGGASVVWGGGVSGVSTNAMTIGAFSALSTGAVVATVQYAATLSSIRQLVNGLESGANGDWEVWTQSSKTQFYAGATKASGSTFTGSTWHTIVANFAASASSQLFVDGVSQATGTVGTNSFGGSGFTLGNTVTPTSAGWHGGMTEFLIVPTTLTTAQVAQYSTWATAQWGVN